MYRSINRFIPRQVVRRSTQLVNQLWTGSPTQSQLLTSQPTSSATTTRSNMTDAKKTLDIQIISDNICPFCYLGKKKIEAAVATLGPDVKVNYDWRPFQLDPTLPTESVNKIERYKKKFGADRVGPMLDQMKANGRPYGIEFSYGGNIGNTVNSHRLVDWSKQPSQGGGQHTDALINKLFNAYFEREADIASLDTLADIGSSVLPASREEVMTFLKSDQLRDHVLSQMEDARNADVSGVPHFIIDGKYSVSGAQEPQTFQAIFKKLGY